jgi:hypothetical protein
VDIEAYSPRKEISPSIGINLIPPENVRKSERLEVFDTWRSVADFVVRTNDDSAAPNDAIRAKVAELTAKCDAPMDRIRALCKYVQSVNYTAVGLNLCSGGGYRPASASEVFAKNYGDCKGKTALLRAMLACIGVKSYAVLCNWDDDTEVHSEWPTSGAFNHCIIAIVPPEGTENGAIVAHPQLGRLMLFDPTNNRVPLGAICEDLEDTYFLVGSRECAELAKFPMQEFTRRIDIAAKLDADGALSGSFKESDKGSLATRRSSMKKDSKPSDFEVFVADIIRKQTSSAKLVKWSVDDKFDDNGFGIDIDFNAPGYARHIGTGKMLFKAFVDSELFHVPERPKSGARKTPFLVPQSVEEAHSKIAIPDGYAVDEMPKDMSLKTEFGEINLHCAVEGNVVKLDFKRTQSSKLMPPEAYDSFISFYRARNKAVTATVVIAKSDAR